MTAIKLISRDDLRAKLDRGDTFRLDHVSERVDVPRQAHPWLDPL